MVEYLAHSLGTIECADLCLQCANVCRETAIYCLEQGIAKLDSELIRILTDSVKTTEITRNLLLQNVPEYLDACQRSAEVCHQATGACEHLSDDVVLKHCAEICRRCENVCRRHGTLFYLEEIPHTPSPKKQLY